jgi:autotransporter-associated beta strand protein
MLPPWIVASNTTAAFPSTFVDVAPGTESTTGLVPVTYVPGPLTGGTGTEIADYTAAATLTGVVEVAAVRTNSALTGGTLKINSGGFLLSANTANPTLSTNLDFTGVEGVLQNVSGSANPIFSGIITAPNGFTKSGSNSVILNNPANNLSGGVTIDEANLRVGAANAFGTNDPVVTINAAGTMDLQNNQSIGGLRGDGQFTNSTTTARTLTINTATGTVFDFTGVVLAGSAAISVTKSGPGIQIFSGDLAHTGATTVNGGLLQVDGVSTNASAYTVNTGATLGGKGIITGAVTVNAGGNLSPGASPGTLRTGNLTLSALSNYRVELNGPAAGTGYDQVDVLGAVNVSGATLVATLNYAPSAGDLLYIINNDQLDFVTGTFANLPQGATLTLLSTADNQSYPFTISYTGESLTGQYENIGNDVVLRAVVPEPSTVGLLGIAAAGLLARRRRARMR